MRRSAAYLLAIRAINNNLARVKHPATRAELIAAKDFLVNDSVVAREELPEEWARIVRGRSGQNPESASVVLAVDPSVALPKNHPTGTNTDV